jgi:predicted branched-subunit amino acid permease
MILTEAPARHRSGPAADVLRLVPSMGPFGVALGVTAMQLSQSGLNTVLGAGLLYAGSAQLTVITMFANGTGAAAVLAAGLLVNARLLLYGAALEPRFRQQKLWFRLLAAHFIIDATFANASQRPHDEPPEQFRRYWCRLGAGVLALWTGSVTIGVLMGPKVPPLPHLGLVGLALFAGLLAPRLTSRPPITAAAAAALAALLAACTAPQLAVPVGAVAGIAAGALTDRGRTSDE